MKLTCSRCSNPSRPGQRYCLACHAASVRATRRTYAELTLEMKAKANARSTVHVALKRGKLTKTACERCGSANVEAHHDDYSRPLEVRWVCRRCHGMLHNFKAQ